MGDACVLTQGRDGFLRTWDVRGGLRGPLVEASVDLHSFCQCAPLPEDAAAGPRVVALPTAGAQEVMLYDLRQRAEVRVIPPSGKTGMCMCLRWVGGSLLLAGWEDGAPPCRASARESRAALGRTGGPCG